MLMTTAIFVLCASCTPPTTTPVEKPTMYYPMMPSAKRETHPPPSASSPLIKRDFEQLNRQLEGVKGAIQKPYEDTDTPER